MSRAAASVNRECGLMASIGVGSGELLGIVILISCAEVGEK
jgi:hypothetical protein